MTRKLSPTMQKALAEIVLQGGEVHPDGSCYWRSKPLPQGARLQYKLSGADGHVSCVVETSSIKGLIARGALELIGKADFFGNQSYRATVIAIQLCG